VGVLIPFKFSSSIPGPPPDARAPRAGEIRDCLSALHKKVAAFKMPEKNPAKVRFMNKY
jgi:hypothetical protein